MEIKFEVPYNFAKTLIPFYAKYNDKIRFIYLPPFRDDSINTRSSIETKKKGWCYMPKSRSEYEAHLELISQANLKFVVLWQHPSQTITTDQLTYYTSLGASGFIVGNDANAHVIKQYNPNLVVICSLVQRICSDILTRDFSDYDYILLYYPYNRALDALKELTFIKHKLIIMPNSLCHVDCPSMFHWFPSKNSHFEMRSCPSFQQPQNSSFISPKHLYLFDNYVAGYKLQGREYPTELLMYICETYFKRDSAVDLLEALMGKESSDIIRQHMQHLGTKDYYNTKTQAIKSGLFYHFGQ